MTKLSRRTFLAGGASAIVTGALLRSQPTQGSTAQPKFELERFIEDVKRANQERSSQEAVQEVLARAVSEPSAVLEGLGAPRQAGLRTLYRAPDLTILNVIWAPLMVLLPHDHQMWATIGIYTGREDNITWERQGNVIEAAGAASLSEREVFALGDAAIHSVTNPIGRLTGAIHIYGGDFFATPRSEWDAEALTERPLDMERLKRSFEEAAKRYDSGG